MLGRSTRMALLVLVLPLVLAMPARADYDARQRAWDAERFTEAVKEWQAAAAAGNDRAMLALGRAFVTGLGVPQDYVEAHKWLNLAAARGDAQAAAERDALAQKMTVEEQAEARRQARAWRTAGGEATAPPPVAEDPGPPPVEALREAQVLLAALGYTPGPADGIWGRRSVQAYQSFLRDAGQPPAETLTPQALHAMRAIAERQDVEADVEADVATGSETPPSAATVSTQPALPPDALHLAVKAGDLDGLKAALESGADVDARDGQGWTALMHAANEGYTLLVPPLLEAKADPDVRAPDGATALFMAAVHGHSEIIALLMKAGADTSLKGPKGKTAGDVARVKYGGLDIAQENDERAEVLELIQSGRPTRNEIERTTQKTKQSIERNLLKCGRTRKSTGDTSQTGVIYARFTDNQLEVRESSRSFGSASYSYAEAHYTFDFEDVELSWHQERYEQADHDFHGLEISGNIRKRFTYSYKDEGVSIDQTTMTNAAYINCDRQIAYAVIREFKSVRKIANEN